MFEPLIVCCTFLAEFLPSKLCHTRFDILNMCTSSEECGRVPVKLRLCCWLNPSRNSDRNKTSACYKAIIVDKNTCEPLNIVFIALNVVLQPSFQP